MIKVGQARNHGYIDGEMPATANTNRGVGPKYYSEAERIYAEKTKGAKDILEILAENPKLNATIHYPEYEERARRIEAQAAKERADAERVAVEQAEAQRLNAGRL
jgi:hypothetical protein